MSQESDFYEVKQEETFEEKAMSESFEYHCGDETAEYPDQLEACCLCTEGIALRDLLVKHLQLDHSSNFLIE